MNLKSYILNHKCNSSFLKGFTLIELLVVIAVLGVLAAGVFAALDPVDKIAAANDSKAQTDVAAIANATEAYAVSHGGFYPKVIGDLTTTGELRVVPSVPTSAYAPYFFVSADVAGATGPCVAGVSCTRVLVGSELKSKRFTSLLPATPTLVRQVYDTKSGKTCQVDALVALAAIAALADVTCL